MPGSSLVFNEVGSNLWGLQKIFGVTPRLVLCKTWFYVQLSRDLENSLRVGIRGP